MKVIDILTIFWNKEIHILVSAFSFLFIVVNFALPILSTFTAQVVGTSAILIAFSAIAKTLKEVFEL